MDPSAANIDADLNRALTNALDVAVQVIIFVLILLLGWLISAWLHRWLTPALRRLGVDRAVARGGFERYLGATSASNLISRLIVAAFMLLVLQLAFGIFGPNPVSDLIRSVLAWLPKLFAAVIIVIVTAAIAGWVRQIIADALDGVGYGRAVAIGVQVVILTIGIIAALDQIGVATGVTMAILITALATVGGVVVVGLGGGLIRPMQHRWERILNRAQTETALVKQQARHNQSAEATRPVSPPPE